MRQLTTLRGIASTSLAIFTFLLATHNGSTLFAALFSNGSFEDPDVGGLTGKGLGFINATDGWDVTAGRVTIFDDSSGSGPASAGDQFITLRDNGTSIGVSS